MFITKLDALQNMSVNWDEGKTFMILTGYFFGECFTDNSVRHT